MVEVTTSGQAGTPDLNPNPAFPTATLVERKDMTEDLMVIKLEPSENRSRLKPVNTAHWDWARSSGPIP